MGLALAKKDKKYIHNMDVCGFSHTYIVVTTVASFMLLFLQYNFRYLFRTIRTIVDIRGLPCPAGRVTLIYIYFYS